MGIIVRLAMIPRVIVLICAFAACAGLLASCDLVLPPAPRDDSILDGPVDGLTGVQSLIFTRGDASFNDRVFTSADGLGPYFVATSCGSCHAGDGKGHPFTTLTRFGQSDPSGNAYLDRGGPQLQNRALPGFTPERLPPGATSTRLTPPAVTGLGFLEAVPDSTLLVLSDPADLDGDGISGVASWLDLPSFVTPGTDAVLQNGKYIGRFGKKAGAYNLFQQTVVAYNQDIGVTSSFLPENPVNPADGVHPVPSTTPEVTEEEINAVVFYLQTLKAPIQRTPDDPTVLRGEAMFTQSGCGGCHTPTLRTGPSAIPAIAHREVRPYTDLLLHDMGPDLDDGYTEGSALSSEWRTPALWGLGLSPRSQGGEYFLMHDGRARSIAGAILLHGGEAARSRDAFRDLSDADRRALLKFLESL